jgi:hypothetical protein
LGDCKVGNADDTPVFINNSSERSEVTCACDKLKTELQKNLNRTQISTKKYWAAIRKDKPKHAQMVLLSTDACYLHQENSTQLELKTGTGFMFPHCIGKETIRQKYNILFQYLPLHTTMSY